MLRALLTAGLLLVAVPALGDTPASSTTGQSGTFNGVALRYSATAAETIVPDASGHPAASMVTFAYVREGVADESRRPVMFVFNGGPGASSSPLHTHALGPLRIVGDTKLEPNPYSVLDATDLVFIDPIGTGVSRPLAGVDGQPFWTVSGDASSVAYVIRKWLADHHREASPHFLCGESYGASRAAEITKIAPDLTLDGVLLVSMTGNPGDADLPYVLMLPSFATTAAFHGKVDARGRSPEQIFEDAARFARTDYVTALIQGVSLPLVEKTRIANAMSAMIGLPADFIASRNLRIEKSEFVLNLVKDTMIGQIDSRATGAMSAYAGQQPPHDDPSMFGPSPPQGRSTSDILQDYLTKDLKFPTHETYKSLNLEINAKWKFDDELALKSPASLIGEALKTRAGTRVFWSGAYYDLATPIYAGIYTLDHSGIPAERLTVARFPTGHMVYEGDENLARFTKAVRTFVTAP